MDVLGRAERGEIGAVVTCHTRGHKRTKAILVIIGRQPGIPAVSPGDDVVDQQRRAVGGGDARTASGRSIDTGEVEGGVVGDGEVAEDEVSRPDDATTVRHRHAREALGQGDVAHGLRGGRVVATGEVQRAAIRNDRQRVVDTVGGAEGNIVEESQEPVSQRELIARSITGNLAAILQGHGTAVDERAAVARIGLIIGYLEIGVTRLVEEDRPRDLAAPRAIRALNVDERRGSCGSDLAARIEIGTVRRTEGADHLGIPIEVERGARCQAERLGIRGHTALGALPQRIFSAAQRNRSAQNREVIATRIEVLLSGKGEIAAKRLGNVRRVGNRRLHGQVRPGVHHDTAFGRGKRDGGGGGRARDRAEVESGGGIIRGLGSVTQHVASSARDQDVTGANEKTAQAAGGADTSIN